MKICVLTHVCPRFKNDTVGAFMDGFCGGLQGAGNDVTLFTAYSYDFKRDPSDYAFKIKTYKYIFPNRLHILGYDRTLLRDMRMRRSVYFLAPFLFFWGTLSLLIWTSRERPDIIHAHWILPNGFIAAVVSKMKDVPVVVSVPGSDALVARQNIIFRSLARFATNTANLITSNSPHLRDSLISEIGIDRTKFAIVPYGVGVEIKRTSSSELGEIKDSLGIEPNELVILAVSRLVYKKGLRYLIEAIPQVRSARKFRVVIVGWGPLRAELEGLISRLGVEGKVIMAGGVGRDQISKYYNMADIFVMASIMDESGNLDDQSVAITEAMACGKPIIATDWEGNRLAVKDGVNGFIVPEKDSSAIAGALDKLIDSPQLRREMGRQGLKLAEEEFNFDIIGRNLSQIFKDILQKRHETTAKV